jgi:hypothetical protein
MGGTETIAVSFASAGRASAVSFGKASGYRFSPGTVRPSSRQPHAVVCHQAVQLTPHSAESTVADVNLPVLTGVSRTAVGLIFRGTETRRSESDVLAGLRC